MRKDFSHFEARMAGENINDITFEVYPLNPSIHLHNSSFIREHSFKKFPEDFRK